MGFAATDDALPHQRSVEINNMGLWCLSGLFGRAKLTALESQVLAAFVNELEGLDRGNVQWCEVEAD
jgi:hypothetical protein